MPPVRLTANAVAGFRRALRPTTSESDAYRELQRACRSAQFSPTAPAWLRDGRADNDGYLLLDGGRAALPVRRGRVVACLVQRAPAASLSS
jgi:hypothetical protein